MMLEDGAMRAVGLFSGIGGFELGLAGAGIETELVCESWSSAAAVLRHRFDADVVGDIRDLPALPSTDVVTAGFPCTDLTQVGRGAGIDGNESGLVREVFRLIRSNAPTWVVLENVPNMLNLHGGAAMHVITDGSTISAGAGPTGPSTRSTSVSGSAAAECSWWRRRTEDPRAVLFADETAAPAGIRAGAYGFYWTEGNRGLGWGEGVTPTLKGGSQLGIPSPPAVWVPGDPVGLAISRPSIAAGERLQGFRSGWTRCMPGLGERWKMVGNAVTVPVARWIGSRLRAPGDPVDAPRRRLPSGSRWPSAASSVGGAREAWALSERPIAVQARQSLAVVLDVHGSEPLTLKATSGFTRRLKASRLSTMPGFISALDAHMSAMSS